MLEAPEGFYDSDKYELQIISRGVCENKIRSDLFSVETLTFRVNYAGLFKWRHGHSSFTRDCYETEQEWQRYLADAAVSRKKWARETTEKLGLSDGKGDFHFFPLISKFFTAIRISKVECPSCEGPNQK